MCSKFLTTITTLFFVAFCGVAQATTFTFGDGSPIFPTGYTEAGMTISNISPPPVNFAYVRDWQATTCCYTTTGTERELLFNTGDLTSPATRDFVFSLVSGGTFDLQALDFEDPGNNFSTSGYVRVLASNGANQLFDPTAFGTAVLVGFQNIVSFTLRCEGGCQATVDNIVFSENLAAVPLPAALPLFVTGLGAMGLVAWRRNRKVAAKPAN
jgi:hypothetical protein